MSDRNFCLPSAVRFRRSNGLFLLYHAFLFEMDITDLKNGHVIPKFWVLENLLLKTFLWNWFTSNPYTRLDLLSLLILGIIKLWTHQTYWNSNQSEHPQVGFLHGIGSLTGPIIFGVIATDMEVESMLFTVAAIFTTLTVVTTPLSLLFVAADLRWEFRRRGKERGILWIWISCWQRTMRQRSDMECMDQG